MEPEEIVWQGKIGDTPLRVGVPHEGRIIAEWDVPGGSRHKVSDSVAEFERAVLFQLMLAAGVSDEAATREVVAAVTEAQAARPAPKSDNAQRRRKNPKVRQHRRSRTPPRRR